MIPINTLISAYRAGYFPMATAEGLRWFSPRHRGVLPLDAFHVPRRLARVVRGGRFDVTVNRDFRRVIGACASRPDDTGNWIDHEIEESYIALHEARLAHSVEVWRGSALVGGLYGVSLQGAFFGESMFHVETDASKVALCELVRRLRVRRYRLLDLQWVTPHLARFGAIEISRPEYLRRLADALRAECSFEEPNAPRGSAS